MLARFRAKQDQEASLIRDYSEFGNSEYELKDEFSTHNNKSMYFVKVILSSPFAKAGFANPVSDKG